MLQNKLIFNQSSVSLEIIGLPDLSDNEGKDQISIISQWRLQIIDKPLIEGNKDHLISIMNAFYVYTNYLINNENSTYESKLINIKADNLFTHYVLLKSSKPDVEPLKLKIGNSILTDIINCFDQLNSSNKVRKTNQNFLENMPKKRNYIVSYKNKIIEIFVPPFLSLFSLFIFSSAFIYFYDVKDYDEEKTILNYDQIFDSAKSTKAILWRNS